MGRKILALIVGLIAAIAVVMIVEMLNSFVIPPPGSEITGDPARLREFMTSLPITAYVMILIGYLLGAFAGGFIATKLSRRESPGPSIPLIIGIILTIFGALNFFVALPGQPVWFIAASLVSFIPASFIGHRIAR